MRRMNKNYNITEQTNAIIKAVAEELAVPESYALDSLCLSYWRMAHGKDRKPMPTPTNAKRKYNKKDDKNKPAEHESFPAWVKRTTGSELPTLSQNQAIELAEVYNNYKKC